MYDFEFVYTVQHYDHAPCKVNYLAKLYTHVATYYSSEANVLK